jgi:hypothetical protein
VLGLRGRIGEQEAEVALARELAQGPEEGRDAGKAGAGVGIAAAAPARAGAKMRTLWNGPAGSASRA